MAGTKRVAGGLALFYSFSPSRIVYLRCSIKTAQMPVGELPSLGFLLNFNRTSVDKWNRISVSKFLGQNDCITFCLQGLLKALENSPRLVPDTTLYADLVDNLKKVSFLTFVQLSLFPLCFRMNLLKKNYIFTCNTFFTDYHNGFQCRCCCTCPQSSPISRSGTAIKISSVHSQCMFYTVWLTVIRTYMVSQNIVLHICFAICWYLSIILILLIFGGFQHFWRQSRCLK